MSHFLYASTTRTVLGFLMVAGLGLTTATNVAADTLDDTYCPPLSTAYGPFDYRSASDYQKILVEGAHFFPAVETLRRGTYHPTKGYAVIPGSEIDYTLRVFPNHPRALMSLSKLGIRDKTDRPKGVKAPVPCYFKEAMRFRPNDSMVRIIFGIHLNKLGRTKEALDQFDKAKELGEESANLYYNLGLAYIDVKRYPEALEAAHKAYAMKFPLPGLKDKLVKAGVWKDPPPPPAPEAKPAEQEAGNPAPAVTEGRTAPAAQ